MTDAWSTPGISARIRNCLPMPNGRLINHPFVARFGPQAFGRPAPTAVYASARADARHRRCLYMVYFQSAHGGRQPGR